MVDVKDCQEFVCKPTNADPLGQLCRNCGNSWAFHHPEDDDERQVDYLSMGELD